VGGNVVPRTLCSHRQHAGTIDGYRAQAEEIAGDVFHKLSQRPGLLQSRDDIAAWIYRVATNAGLDALRTNSRRRQREEAAGREGLHAAAPVDALNEMLREERRVRVRSVLGALKPREAQLLLLRANGWRIASWRRHRHRAGVRLPSWRGRRRNLNAGFGHVTETMYESMLV
jgi:hypothetical protein